MTDTPGEFTYDPNATPEEYARVWEDLAANGGWMYDADGTLLGHIGPAVIEDSGDERWATAPIEVMPVDPDEGDA